jgi:membrane-associated protease RseP (regulator of RpoE activity)
MKLSSGLYLLCVVVVFTGCAGRKGTHERGWVGGEFVRAKPPAWNVGGPDAIGAFPTNLVGKYQSGLVITELAPTSPLAKAGLQETDLIVACNGQPTGKVRKFRETIDGMEPGTPIQLTVYRDSALAERTAIVGKETFKQAGTFMMGIGLSSHLHFDLLPNPDFSLVALGYESNHDRLQLDSPRWNYIRSISGPQSEPGFKSSEGWRTWLAIFSLSDHKKILAQEIVEAPTPKESAAPMKP